MYNLENIFIPFFSPIISIIIFFGLHFFGKKIVNFLKLEELISRISNSSFQYSLIGIVFTTFFLYPIIILNKFNLIFINFLSYLLIFFGIFFLIKKFRKTPIKFNELNIEAKIIYLIIIGYVLLALSPTTNADSLDYHLGIPMYILNNEIYPNFKFWFHFAISGSGEIFYILSLINHAEQLPALTQISSILSLLGIILKRTKLSENKNNYKLALIMISCPVLIFFAASAKVQLIYVAGSSLIFTLIFFSNEKEILSKNFFIFTTIILITAISAKFSFVLSSILLWSYIFYISLKKKLTFHLLLISFIVFSYIFVPKITHRIDLYNLDFLQSIIFPLPINMYGYSQLYNSLTSCGYNGCFPYWLVFPKNLGTFTESLGIGSLAIFILNFKKDNKLIIILLLISVQIIASHSFGPNNARWYLEPFMWSLITLKYYGIKNNNIEKIFYKLGFLQSILIIAPIIYGVYSLTPGSLSENSRFKVMTKNADGYELFKWVNEIRKKNDIILSTHRSFSLGGHNVIPGDILMYIEPNDKRAIVYFEEIKKLKPNLILFYDDKKYFKNLKNCIGKLLHYKKNVAKKASRNPFNRVSRNYDGFIYELHYEKLPFCLVKN